MKEQENTIFDSDFDDRLHRAFDLLLQAAIREEKQDNIEPELPPQEAE